MENEEGVKQIKATVDGKSIVVTEAIIRQHLQFNDASGITVLSNDTLFEQFNLMGYEGSLTSVTFLKALLSPQWKFLVHIVHQCLTQKRTCWNEFGSTVASAIVCLATGHKIPKLEFNEYSFQVSTDDENQLSEQLANERKKLTNRFRFIFAMYQVLVLHRGPLLEFTLSMKQDGTSPDLHPIFLHLSKTITLKKISLIFGHSREFRLPLSIVSLHHLTHLYLHMGHLDHQPTFIGFGNLKSLYLTFVNIYTKTLLHLISNCPLLTHRSLFFHEDNIFGNESSTITELFECVRMIENLRISHWIIQCFAHDGVTQVLPTKLVHLKHFGLEDLCFSDGYGLSFVGLVLRNSPNLEKLMIMMYDYPSPEDKIDSLEDYSDIWLEHLNDCEIGNFRTLKPELQFVKLILAKSPVLKKMSIYLNDDVTKDEEMLLLRTLLRSSHVSVSPMVDIIVERYPFE